MNKRSPVCKRASLAMFYLHQVKKTWAKERDKKHFKVSLFMLHFFRHEHVNLWTLHAPKKSQHLKVDTELY